MRRSRRPPRGSCSSATTARPRRAVARPRRSAGIAVTNEPVRELLRFAISEDYFYAAREGRHRHRQGRGRLTGASARRRSVQALRSAGQGLVNDSGAPVRGCAKPSVVACSAIRGAGASRNGAAVAVVADHRVARGEQRAGGSGACGRSRGGRRPAWRGSRSAPDGDVRDGRTAARPACRCAPARPGTRRSPPRDRRARDRAPEPLGEDAVGVAASWRRPSGRSSRGRCRWTTRMRGPSAIAPLQQRRQVVAVALGRGRRQQTGRFVDDDQVLVLVTRRRTGGSAARRRRAPPAPAARSPAPARRPGRPGSVSPARAGRPATLTRRPSTKTPPMSSSTRACRRDSPGTRAAST